MKLSGYRTGSLDIKYGPRVKRGRRSRPSKISSDPMDILSPSGFASLVQHGSVPSCSFVLYMFIPSVFKIYIYIYTKTIDPSNIQENKRPNPDVFSDQDYPPSFVVSWSHLRVSIASILKCARRFLAFFAIKCASWTSINQGTSHRSACSSVGFDEYASVSSSNAMLERTPIYNLLSNQFSQILRSINI